MQSFRNEKSRIEALIGLGRQFLIVTHVDPDGDALGGAFGLAHILKGLGKLGIVGLNQPLPRRYEFLNHDDEVRVILAEKANLDKYDAVFALDAGDLRRLDAFQPLLEENKGGKPVVNIDHHPDNREFGDINVVDSDAASTCQLIVELFGGRQLSARAAECLYAGIVYDTGSFRHGNELKRAHEAAVQCLRHPIDTKQVYDRLFAIETEASLRLFSRALATLSVTDRGRMAHMYLANEVYRELKLEPEDSAGFISRLLLIEGAQLVLFFNETERNVVKISLRANGDLNVGEIAMKFGGGGHAKAAGCVIEGALDRVIERVLKTIRVAAQGKDDD